MWPSPWCIHASYIPPKLTEISESLYEGQGLPARYCPNVTCMVTHVTSSEPRVKEALEEDLAGRLMRGFYTEPRKIHDMEH